VSALYLKSDGGRGLTRLLRGGQWRWRFVVSRFCPPLLNSDHILLSLQEYTPSSCRTVSAHCSSVASTRPDFLPPYFPPDLRLTGAFQIVDPTNQTIALESWSAINGTAISVVNNTEGVSSALPNSLQVEVVDGSAAFANSGYWGQSYLRTYSSSQTCADGAIIFSHQSQASTSTHLGPTMRRSLPNLPRPSRPTFPSQFPSSATPLGLFSPPSLSPV
jgi:hypothetical protein